jgi:hypothetical protein
MSSSSQRIIRALTKTQKSKNVLLSKYTEIGFKHGSSCRRRNWVVDIESPLRLPPAVTAGEKAEAKEQERKVQARRWSKP